MYIWQPNWHLFPWGVLFCLLARINSSSIFGRRVLFLAAKTGTPLHMCREPRATACYLKYRQHRARDIQYWYTIIGHTNLIPGFSSKAGCEFTPTDEAFDIACWQRHCNCLETHIATPTPAPTADLRSSAKGSREVARKGSREVVLNPAVSGCGSGQGIKYQNQPDAWWISVGLIGWETSNFVCMAIATSKWQYLHSALIPFFPLTPSVVPV